MNTLSRTKIIRSILAMVLAILLLFSLFSAHAEEPTLTANIVAPMLFPYIDATGEWGLQAEGIDPETILWGLIAPDIQKYYKDETITSIFDSEGFQNLSTAASAASFFESCSGLTKRDYILLDSNGYVSGDIKSLEQMKTDYVYYYDRDINLLRLTGIDSMDVAFVICAQANDVTTCYMAVATMEPIYYDFAITIKNRGPAEAVITRTLIHLNNNEIVKANKVISTVDGNGKAIVHIPVKQIDDIIYEGEIVVDYYWEDAEGTQHQETNLRIPCKFNRMGIAQKKSIWTYRSSGAGISVDSPQMVSEADYDIPTIELTQLTDETIEQAAVLTKANPVYTDVPDNAWYKESVQLAAELGILAESADGKFEPTRAVTSNEFLEMLQKVVSVGREPKNPFENFIVAIQQSVDTNAALSREQICEILWKYSESPLTEKPAPTILQQYPDNAAIAPALQEGVAWAVEKGLITGTGAGQIEPERNVSRAETITLLLRYKQIVLDGEEA